MEVFNIKDMVKGWFVGDFTPTVLKTDLFEVGYKEYKQGDFEKKHYHLKAIELTLIARGRVRMFDKTFTDGDIIQINPGEVTSFEALEDTLTIVVKAPSVKNDKYFSE